MSLHERGESEKWQDACVISIYEGKGVSCECKNLREISMLSTYGKMFSMMVLERI